MEPNRPLPDAFFRPGTVAIVGASKKSPFGKGIPTMLDRNGYGGRLYLVNPREKEMFGLPVYPRLTDIPVPIDLAIVLVPGSQVHEVLTECIDRKVPAVVLETAGFSETGSAGALLEDEVRRLLSGTKTRVIGPNCIGLINTHARFATTELDLGSLRPGNIGVIAQSGTFGNIVADWAPTQDLGFSKLVTIGNRVDVDEADCLSYFADDDQTEVIVLYLEGVKDGARFHQTARAVSRRKPVLVYKGGSSTAGRKAAASHTGSMTGEDILYEGLLRQSGVIRASSFHELFDMAKVFSREPLMTGTRVCVITCSGSLGVIAVDACMGSGLQIPDLSPATISALREIAPPWMNVRNPLDVGPSGTYVDAVKAVLADPLIDGIIACPVIPDLAVRNLAASGVDVRTMYGDPEELRSIAPHKPFLLFTVGGAFWMELVHKTYGATLSIVSSPESAAHCLAALYRYGRFRAGNLESPCFAMSDGRKGGEHGNERVGLK